MDFHIVIGSAIVGLLVGMTGAGGGALMTPMLILLFSVKPNAAISSDLVAALLMRPVGAAVHLRRGTVNVRLAGWLAVGAVPAAFTGALILHLFGDSKAASQNVLRALGAALLLGAAAMVIRYILDRRAGHERRGLVREVTPRRWVTVAIGVVGGLVVGITSVGAGSLMIVLLMFAYPTLAANQLVGTDLFQAIPLTASAALGALVFGHVDVPVTSAIVVGSVPAVLAGSLMSSRVADRYLRPIIGVVILASGLKYSGLPTRELGFVMLTVVVLLAAWLIRMRLATATANDAPVTPTVPKGRLREREALD
jgi:uncharacterized membrane protein YfcA